jgi:hypothetical protein
VAKIITFDRGSKQRIRQIRWTRLEIVSAILTTVIVTVLCLLALLWELSHESEEPDVPALRDVRPAS